MVTDLRKRPPSYRAVAIEVLRHGPLSRVELAQRLQLSQGTLTRLTRPLLDEGFLIEALSAPHSAVPSSDRSGRAPAAAGRDPGSSRTETRIGRRGQPLEVAAQAHHFIGVKITGSSAHAVLTTLRADVVGAVESVLPSQQPEAVVATITDLVAGLKRAGPEPAALGVTVGGHAADHRHVTRAPFLHWDDVALAEMLEASTGLPTTLENDVLALTEAEHWFGAARGCTRFALVTIGAGVGYGLVVHDQLVSHPDAGIGMVGHWPLEVPSAPCDLGHRGCASGVLTIPAITRAVSGPLGRALSYEECLDLALAGEPAAKRAVEDAARGLGRLLGAVTNLTMPEKVVVTGDGVRLAIDFAAQVRAGLDADRHPRASEVPIDVRQFDFTEWARGAAVVALQQFIRADRAQPQLPRCVLTRRRREPPETSNAADPRRPTRLR